jgi:hypothetical protein
VSAIRLLLHASILTAVCTVPAAAQRFSPPKTVIDTILVEQTSRAGINYGVAYEGARRGEAPALTELFRASYYVDGVGADQHSQVLWDILRAWGDSSFAAVLSGQPDSLRIRIRCYLDYAACALWASDYPRTARLAVSNPKCVCK